MADILPLKAHKPKSKKRITSDVRTQRVLLTSAEWPCQQALPGHATEVTLSLTHGLAATSRMRGETLDPLLRGSITLTLSSFHLCMKSHQTAPCRSANDCNSGCPDLSGFHCESVTTLTHTGIHLWGFSLPAVAPVFALQCQINCLRVLAQRRHRGQRSVMVTRRWGVKRLPPV